MDTKIVKSLISYGLTENEASIYIALLEKLEATVFEIAQKTEIPRATVYLTLEKMKKLGLVSALKKNNVLYFTPESTKRLSELLESRRQSLEEILPELNALIDIDSKKPTIRMYTGRDGVKIVLEDILETMARQKINILYAASHSELLEMLPKYFPNWQKKREAQHIRTKLILPEGDRAKHPFPSNELRETRYLPKGFPFQATVELYGNKIAVFSFRDKEIHSIIIESSPTVEMFAQFFLFAWEHAEK